MSPKDFIAARERLLVQPRSSNEGFVPRFKVDDRVYLPTLYAYDGDDDSVRRVAGSIFRLEEDVMPKLQISFVPGGITNKLYLVSGMLPSSTPNEAHEDDIPTEVLVRIFGGHGLIDRDVETSTYAALARQGIALPYYGRFGNGRLEAWCPNATHLHVRELSHPILSRGIAQSLGRLHSQFVIPEHLQQYHNPQATPTLWTQLESWLHQAQQASFDSESDTKRTAALHLTNLPNELMWLKNYACHCENAKVGFCHNDLLAANILKRNGTETMIQLIDFEYGGMNYLAYDIANHFNEFAGGTNEDENATPDYSLFPSLELQKLFVKVYLAASRANNDDEAVQALLLEVNGFVLANHLVWGLWAVNQASTEGCQEFDYLTYASCRIRRYFMEKEEWLSSKSYAQ